MNKTEQNVARIEKAMDTMRRAMVGARERLGEGLQLTRTQLEILLILIENPQTTSDLAKRLFLTQSAITQTIDTLVRRDLVERHPSEHDRRIIELHLSPSGQELTSRVCGLRRQHMESLIATLTSEEIEVLITVTEKLTTLFEETKPQAKQP
jgi:DNA-binding MarR family transcriptional regulator